ncbi:MAG: YMGG-like glycine zipper-containing protein [Gemmatimonadaceae bacterium]
MTNRHVVIGMFAFGLIACDGGDKTASSDTTGAGKDGASSMFSSKSTVASGTSIEVTLSDGISSRTDKVGNLVGASVTRDVLDDQGKVVIAAGSPVGVQISAIAPAKKGSTSAEGTLELTVTSLTVDGVQHSMNAVVGDVPHTMKGRGMTTQVKQNLAVGTAIGAIAGQVISKNTKGTVIGGAVGATAGGVVSVANAQRDIVVSPGTHISFSLPQSITVANK